MAQISQKSLVIQVNLLSLWKTSRDAGLWEGFPSPVDHPETTWCHAEAATWPAVGRRSSPLSSSSSISMFGSVTVTDHAYFVGEKPEAQGY